LAGQLRPDCGGGLCQLSGLIYYASLMAGLGILERHPHSLDIYDDHNRYAPLGADATVAFGFKDLRVLNAHTFPLCFRASVTSSAVSCCVCSPEPINAREIEFVRTAESGGVTTVETRSRRPGDAGYRVLNVSTYRHLNTDHALP
jgi:vancomycin resistance protein VanW